MANGLGGFPKECPIDCLVRYESRSQESGQEEGLDGRGGLLFAGVLFHVE